MTDWKQKLAAYLHDTPSKALDLDAHTDNAAKLILAAVVSEMEINAHNRSAFFRLSPSTKS